MVNVENRPVGLPPISRVSRDGALPLAFAQEGFWILDHLLPGNSFSNVFSAFRLMGPLDPAVLRRAFDEVVRRHEVLRTTFTAVNGHPAQVVSPDQPACVVSEDLVELPAPERDAACLRRILQEATHSFDLSRGPLLRIALFRIADGDHLLLLTIHHIISDDWSVQVIALEMAALYEAFARGRPSPLPAPQVQYADFAVWQRELLQRGALDAQLSYWRNHLGRGELPPLDFPTDHPRPPAPSFHTLRQAVAVPRDHTDALKHAGYEEGCTLFMTLLAALEVVLSDIAGDKDVRVGTLVASRHHEQVEGMVGPLINTLLLRTDLSGDPTLRVVLQRTQKTVLDAFDNQDVPFEALLQALEQDGGIRRDSLVRVLFIFGKASPPRLRMHDIDVHAVDVGKGMLEADIDLDTVTSFDMIVSLAERAEGVTGSLVYKSALFRQSSIRRVVQHFHHVMECIVSTPDERLSKLRPFAGWGDGEA